MSDIQELVTERVARGLTFIREHGAEHGLNIDRLKGWGGAVTSVDRCPLATAGGDSFWPVLGRVLNASPWTDKAWEWATEHGFADQFNGDLWQALADEWERICADL